jgi:hypothetical protein
MASKTQVTERRRRHKRSLAGKKRKKAIAAKGSTRSLAELFGDE